MTSVWAEAAAIVLLLSSDSCPRDRGHATAIKAELLMGRGRIAQQHSIVGGCGDHLWLNDASPYGNASHPLFPR